jgi:hypothetical protein
MKRFQVFVSSTFEDLKDERGIVVENILKLEHIPAGMELFSASNDEQFKYIERVIDESDYYVLIIGNRYGSVDSDGTSYTEKEYDYAVSKGIPILAFLHSDPESLPSKKSEHDPEKRMRLNQFRKDVACKRMVSFWKSADQLSSEVMAALARAFRIHPRPGWERATNEKNGVYETPQVHHSIGASSRINFCSTYLPKAKNSIYVSSPAMITVNSMAHILSDVAPTVSITLGMLDYSIPENSAFVKRFFGVSDEDLQGYVDGFENCVRQIRKHRNLTIIELDLYAPPYYAAVDYIAETEHSIIQANNYAVHEKKGGVSVYTSTTCAGTDFYDFYREQILMAIRTKGKLAKNGIDSAIQPVLYDSTEFDSLADVKQLLKELEALISFLPFEVQQVLQSAIMTTKAELSSSTPNKNAMQSAIEIISKTVTHNGLDKGVVDLILGLIRSLNLLPHFNNSTKHYAPPKVSLID